MNIILYIDNTSKKTWQIKQYKFIHYSVCVEQDVAVLRISDIGSLGVHGCVRDGRIDLVWITSSDQRRARA